MTTDSTTKYATELHAKYAVGDEVWIPQKLEGRMRAFKVSIYAVQVTDYGKDKKVVYYDTSGKPIDAPICDTIETCEQVLNIIDKHRNEMAKEMAEVKGKTENE